MSSSQWFLSTRTGQDVQRHERVLQECQSNVWEVPVQFQRQAVMAPSSAESELYVISSGVAEGLHIRLFLIESGLSKERQH